MSELSRSSHGAPHEYELPSSHGSSRHDRSGGSLHSEDFPLPPIPVSSRHGSSHSSLHSSHHSPAQSSNHSNHSHHSHRSHTSAPTALGTHHRPPSHASGSRHSQSTVCSSSSSSRRPVRKLYEDWCHLVRKVYKDWFGGSSPYTSLNLTPARPNNKQRTTPYLHIQTDWEAAVRKRRRDARKGTIPKTKYMVKGKGKDKGTWHTEWL